METLLNVIDLMLQTAMTATGQCDELEHIYVVSLLIVFFILTVATLRWAVQLTIKRIRR